jgi:hypothetical protein
MKKHHANRLLKLAAFLRELPARKFDLNQWVTKGNPMEDHCGTVACACGWATAIPSFRKAGFRLDRIMLPSGYIRLYPTFAGQEQFEAAARFFGINKSAAEFLFDSDEYPSTRRGPKSVAARIEKFVKAQAA